MFESKSMQDYHEEMMVEAFLMWFLSVVPDSSSSD
jgi:hypothetical protein